MYDPIRECERVKNKRSFLTSRLLRHLPLLLHFTEQSCSHLLPSAPICSHQSRFRKNCKQSPNCLHTMGERIWTAGLRLHGEGCVCVCVCIRDRAREIVQEARDSASSSSSSSLPPLPYFLLDLLLLLLLLLLLFLLYFLLLLNSSMR